jgi:hypothetical protein
MLIVAVGDCSNSTFTDWLSPPLVADPPREIGPEDTIVMSVSDPLAGKCSLLNAAWHLLKASYQATLRSAVSCDVANKYSIARRV